MPGAVHGDTLAVSGERGAEAAGASTGDRPDTSGTPAQPSGAVVAAPADTSAAEPPPPMTGAAGLGTETGAPPSPPEEPGAVRDEGAPARASEPSDRVEVEEPWVIEGASLQGSRGFGTELTEPVVTHGVLRITGRTGRLSEDRNTVTLHEDVRIVDTSHVVTAQTGTYQRFSRMLYLSGDVRGEGPQGTFSAHDLSWDRARGHLVLRGDPQLVEPERVLWADRIEARTERQEGEAIGNVRILILPDSTWAYGSRAIYGDGGGRTVLTGNPWMEERVVPGQPRSIVRGDTLILNQHAQTGQARGNVRIERGELVTDSESALYFLQGEQMRLYGRPVARDRDGEIHADTMFVRVRGREADRLTAYGNVLVRYEPPEKPGEMSILLGDTLVASLRGGVVTGMEAQGNALSLYYPSFTDAMSGTGRNLSEARRIHLEMRSGQIQRVDLIEEASGSYLYPSDSAREKLRSASWLDSLLAADRAADEAVADSLEGSPAEDRNAGPSRADSVDSTTGPVPGDSLTNGSMEHGALDAGATEADSLARGSTAPDSSVSARAIIPDDFAPPRVVAILRARSFDLAEPGGGYDRLFEERVDYSGDTLRFHVPQDRIEISGSGVLEYAGNKLEARDINYLADRELITAAGDPAISDPEATLKGQRMTYRTDERQGLIYQGRTTFDQGYYYGEQIKKLPGDELLVRSGDYTTCDQESLPHYHFHAERMKLILKDKVVARPAILYVKRIPIFALPYYIFPIQKGRRSGVMMPNVELGFNRNRGRFVRNLGYYWAINDYMDARSWLDYYDRGPRIYLNGIYQYRVRYLLDGSFEGSYLRSKDDSGGRQVDWSLQGGHAQTLGEGARGTLRLDFTSNQSYRGDRDFGAGVDERLNRILESSLGLSKNWSRAALNLNAQRTEYLDETTGEGVKVQQNIPSVNFNVNTGAIGRAPDATGRGGRLPFLASTYFGTSWAYRNVYTRRFNGRVSANQAIQENFSLSDNRSLGPYLRLQPGISATVAGFARDNRGRRNQFGAAWSARLQASNTLYGNATIPVGPLQAVRHVIEPSAAFTYSPELRSLTYTRIDSTGSHRVAVFPNVGGIGLGGSKRAAMSFGVTQRFHAKWLSKGKEVKKENIISWTTSSAYDFLADGRRKLSSISNALRLQPFSRFQSTVSVVHDPYSRARESFSASTTVSLSSDMFRSAVSDTAGSSQGTLDFGEFGESQGLEGADLGQRSTGSTGPARGGVFPWTLSISHSYAARRGGLPPSHTLNASTGFNLTPGWKLDAAVYSDLRRREVISHSFTLSRDLHCWSLSFQHRATGSNAEYYFRVAVKEIPEVQYERES